MPRSKTTSLHQKARETAAFNESYNKSDIYSVMADKK